jgi:hypothetical protein
MATDKKARKFTVAWEGGYLTATQYLLEAIYGTDFMQKVGAGAAKNIAVKAHTRQRVIGGPTKNIAAYDYNVVKYARRISSQAAGGQEIAIEIGGDWWTARLGGSVQDFKQFLGGTGKPDQAFQFRTQKGSIYSSAL